MGSFLFLGPSTDMADTVSLPRRPRVHEHLRAWHPDLPITSMAPEKSLDPLCPEPTYGALDRTAELLAKLLSESEDPDLTAPSEAVKAKLGITEPLSKPTLLSPSPGWTTLADDLKRSRVSRLLGKVTCPSPFHPRDRTVPIAELQDVPVTETEKRGLSALSPLAGVSPSPSGLTPGVGKTDCRRISFSFWLNPGGWSDRLPRRTSSWSCRSSTRKICPNGQKNLLSVFCSLANPMWMWPPNAHC